MHKSEFIGPSPAGVEYKCYTLENNQHYQSHHAYEHHLNHISLTPRATVDILAGSFPEKKQGNREEISSNSK